MKLGKLFLAWGLSVILSKEYAISGIIHSKVTKRENIIGTKKITEDQQNNLLKYWKKHSKTQNEGELE